MLKVIIVSFSLTKGGASIAANRLKRILNKSSHIDVESINQDNAGLFQLFKRVTSLFLSKLQFDNNPIKHSLNLFSFKPVLKSFKNTQNIIEKIGILEIHSNDDYHKALFFYLDEWWKNKNEIDNSKKNDLYCYIKNSNIFELYFINSIINSISQVKSNIIQSVAYGNNLQNIIFYGEKDIFITKLFNENIELNFNSNNECIIKLK